MTWQLAAVVLCVLVAGVWMHRVIIKLELLLLLLEARNRICTRTDLRNAAIRFADDPLMATVLSELADGLLTIDEIHDQWEEQKMGAK